MNLLKNTVLVIVFASLIAFGAWTQIPFRPLIPFTLQVFFVLLSAAVLGTFWGTFSLVLYILVGLPVIGLQSFFGLPLFTKGLASFKTLTGSAGGYLWGFLVATLVTGFIIGRRRKKADFYWILMAVLIGLVIIYALGLTQYIFIAKVSLKRIYELNIPAFVASDILKAILAALIAQRLRKLL